MGELAHLPENKEARHENRKLFRLSKTESSEDVKNMNGGLSC